MLPALLQYQRFIWVRAVTDLRHRYAGTGLGIVWNVVHPLALIAIYSIIFTTLMPAPRLEGIPSTFSYPLYLCSGFLPWLAFAECVTRGTGAFLENGTYLKKLPVPEQVFVAQTAASATLGLLVSFSLLVAISLALGLRPTWTWVLLPVPLVAMQVMGFGVGLVLGTVNVFLRDVGQLLAIGLQVALWTVPVVYVVDHLPAWLQRAMAFHPLMPAMSAIRSLFLYGRAPDAMTWGLMAMWAIVAVGVGGWVFSRLRTEIRDVL
jgi:lipopolysaccharide transport system permease protein